MKCNVVKEKGQRRNAESERAHEKRKISLSEGQSESTVKKSGRADERRRGTRWRGRLSNQANDNAVKEEERRENTEKGGQ